MQHGVHAAGATERTFTVEICPNRAGGSCPHSPITAVETHTTYLFNRPAPTTLTGSGETLAEWQRRHAIEALRLAANAPLTPTAVIELDGLTL